MEKKDKNLNVPNLRFPEFSGEWKAVPLSTIADIIGGGTPDTSVDEYWGGNIQWFTPSEIGKGKYAYLSDRTITEAGLKNSSAKLLPQGTVLLSTRATIGECSIATTECTTNQGFQSLVAKENNVSSEFLYYIVAKIKREMLRRSCGSTFLEISANELKKIHTNIPSKAEQEKLVSLLSLIDQRIETQKKIIEKYESLIRGFYQFLFQQAKYDHFVSLGDISQISNGNSDVKDASMYNDGSLYPFFDRSDEIKFLPEYLFDKEAIIYPGEGAEFYPRYYNGKFALHQRCYAVYDISTDFIPRYLYHYCKTQNSYFVRNAVGSTVASLRLDTFKRLKIPAIPTHHQESLVMFLDKIEAKIECNRTILKKYEEQKKYLLFTLFI